LYSENIETIQVNLGFLCNLQCLHCHLDGSPNRPEVMDWPTMEMVLEACRQVDCRLVDITGGAPELNPNFRRFIDSLHAEDFPVQVRTNLTALYEPGLENLPQFYRDRNVRLVASLPCYLEENVNRQRGNGVYQKSVKMVNRLNELGYGSDPKLVLDLVYNPGGAFLPSDQGALEADYKRELNERFGITFSSLIAIANMPIGRFERELRRSDQARDYGRLLRDSFNPDTIENLMCRHQVNVGWDGTLYDCDFNLALGLPVNHGIPSHIGQFDPSRLAERPIVVGEHCFGCTAGAGSSCGGALT
jgi:radical SAM/Cys-rich protein